MGNMCPLDAVVTLNSYYRASRSSDCESGDMADFLRRFSSNCMSLIYLPSHRLPAPLRKQMFMDIGFDESDSRRLLLANTLDIAGDTGTGKVFVDSPEYVPEMARRLRLLRKNAEALQLGAPCSLYRALSHWTQLMKGLGDGSGVPMCVHA